MWHYLVCRPLKGFPSPVNKAQKLFEGLNTKYFFPDRWNIFCPHLWPKASMGSRKICGGRVRNRRMKLRPSGRVQLCRVHSWAASQIRILDTCICCRVRNGYKVLPGLIYTWFTPRVSWVGRLRDNRDGEQAHPLGHSCPERTGVGGWVFFGEKTAWLVLPLLSWKQRGLGGSTTGQR